MSRILVVDDSPSMRQLVSLALSEDGHEATPASDGLEAIRLAAAERFDLVITDLNMPNMNGLEFIQAFRAAGHRFTPVIVLTTEVNGALKAQAKQAGATGWVSKPFVMDQFRTVITKVLQ